MTAQPVMWDEYGLEGDNDGRAYGIHFTDGYEVYDVHWFATAKERDAYMKEYNEDFSAETFNAPAAVMRTYKGRKSPSISAKSVKVGTRKRGNDGKMWQVRSVKSRGKRTQRWFKD